MAHQAAVAVRDSNPRVSASHPRRIAGVRVLAASQRPSAEIRLLPRKFAT
ncbi:Uncharacterised protein [Mycobacteroides abscessus subsp. abscessus]|nr:Uncharacterised protein [Mycobacteroides abscessus subsp. abscessus]